MGTKASFRFDDRQLHYSVREAGRGVEVPIRYEAIIAAEPFTQVGRSGHFIQFIVIAAVITFASMSVVRNVFNDVVAIQIFLLLLIAACILLVLQYRRMTSIRWTAFAVEGHPSGLQAVRVVQNRSHDAIVAELMARWRARLKALHGQVQSSADPAKEVAKFSWLLEQGVITVEEHREAIDRINAVDARSYEAKAEKQLN